MGYIIEIQTFITLPVDRYPYLIPAIHGGNYVMPADERQIIDKNAIEYVT